MARKQARLTSAWSVSDADWRDPAQVVSQWSDAGRAEPGLRRFAARGDWWQVLAEHRITLLVTREYEHLVLAISPHRRSQTYLRLPHPSGLVVDRERGAVFVASTRNPNQIFELTPAQGLIDRTDVSLSGGRSVEADRLLIPVRSTILPGSLYIHDLAMVGSRLHANAVGQNCVVRLGGDGRAERAWWPRCIETPDGPIFTRNYIQLNSIASGRNLRESFFSASTDRMTNRRPSHRNFAVDGRGVVFSGASREVVVRGLTRPHSARLHTGTLWVDNSGYGEVGVVVGEKFEPQIKLPGWTRGLCFHNGVAFVGTSHVIPRFRQFAPGVDPDRSVCGVHAIDVARGTVVGSLVWPAGNQIFAIDWMPSSFSRGLPFRMGRRPSKRDWALFYAFDRGEKDLD